MGVLRTYRKMLIALPLLAVAFFAIPTTNNIQTNDQSPSFKEASAATPFRTINNASEMESFLSECASDTENTFFKDKLVVLNSDVSISITFAATAGGFGGEFNGNGHTVTVKINDTSSDSGVGMFRNIWSTGNVHDLNIAGSVTCNKYAAPLAVYNYGTIKNCSSSVNINLPSVQYVAGFVSFNQGGTIDNCTSSGTLSGQKYASGIVATNYGYVTNCVNNGNVSTSEERVAGVCYRNIGTVENCTNTGTISSTGYIAGGVIAVLGDEPKEAADPYPATYVYNCVNTGTVSGLRSCSGIAAYVLPNARIYYCSNYGNVTCSEVAKVPNYGSGGVVGTMNKKNREGGTPHSDDGVITEVVGCYSSGDITAASCAGGLIGLITSPMSPTVAVKGCLSTGDISNSDTAGYAGTFMGYSNRRNLSITDSWSTGAMKTEGSNQGLGIGGGTAKSDSYSKADGTSTDFKDVIKGIRCFECESISGFGDLYDRLSSGEKELLSTLVYYHPTYTQSYDSAAHYIISYSASSGLSRLSYSFNGNDKTISFVFIITISTTTLFLTFIMMRTIKNKRKNNH